MAATKTLTTQSDSADFRATLAEVLQAFIPSEERLDTDRWTISVTGTNVIFNRKRTVSRVPASPIASAAVQPKGTR